MYVGFSTNLGESDDDWLDELDDDEEDEMGTSSEVSSEDDYETLSEMFSEEIEKAPELSRFFNQVLTAKRDEVDTLRHEKREVDQSLSVCNSNRERLESDLGRARERIQELERGLRAATDDKSGEFWIRFVWWLCGLAIQTIAVGIIFRLIFLSRNI